MAIRKPITADHFKNYIYPCGIKANGSSGILFNTCTVDVKENTYPCQAHQLSSGVISDLPAIFGGANWYQYDHIRKAYVVCETGSDGQDTISQCDPVSGTKTAILSVNRRIAKAAPLSDGSWILQCNDDLRTVDLTKEEIEQQQSYLVIDEFPFWSNGSGICDRKRRRLYLWKNGELTLITPTFMDVGDFVFAGNLAVYYGNEYENIYRPFSNLYTLDLNTLEIHEVPNSQHYNYSALVAIDHNHVFCLRTDRKKYGESQNEYIDWVNLSDGSYQRMNEDCNICMGCSLYTDVAYNASGYGFQKYKNGLMFISTVWDQSPIQYVNFDTGNLEFIVKENFNVMEFVLSEDENTLYFIAENGSGGPELWVKDMQTQTFTQITHYNDHLAEEYFTSEVEPFTFTSTNGSTIGGYLMKPYGYKEGDKCKTVLCIHGGPNMAYGTCYHHEYQYLAACGYAVIFCNPHGSTGRGVEFMDLREKYYTCDLEDILSLHQYAVDHFPCVDKDNIAVNGGSYGGMMVSWIITHYHLFKTAICDRGCANELEDFFMSDCGLEFSLDIRGGTIWQPGVFEKIWDRSPIKYAPNATTPTLFIHGEHDYRCTKEQSLSMFAALKLHGVKSRVYIFKNEHHGLCWNGAPKNRIKRLEVIRQWLEETM